MRPAERRECLFDLGFTIALTSVLFWVDWRATLFFWIPVMWIGSFLVAALYNYLDHVPGNPYDKFLYATYEHPKTLSQKLGSLLDLHNDSCHLTHHHFPSEHWADLPQLQEGYLDEYEKHGSPKNRVLDSALINPFALFLMMYRVNRDRNEVAIIPPTKQ